MYNQKKDNNKFKNKNNQNFQKIELYGSQTTTELKKKHSPRPAGGAETGSWVERTHSKAAAGGPGWARHWLVDKARQWLAEWVVPHSHVDKLGGTTGKRDRPHDPVFQCGEIKPKNL